MFAIVHAAASAAARIGRNMEDLLYMSSLTTQKTFIIEEPCSKLQGIFDRKENGHFLIRSLTPPQAAGNALAVRFSSQASFA
jgi:hypothetical protein